MIKRRFHLAIALTGLLLSACAQFPPHRIATLPQASADARSPLKAWPPECAVDRHAAGGRALCEDRSTSDSPSLQHRFYSSKDGQQGDYYLSFVEFDDQGWFAERKQMEALFVLLKRLEDAGQEVLIHVYAHGWKHDASVCDNNVVCFSRLLERHGLAEVQSQVFRQIREGCSSGSDQGNLYCMLEKLRTSGKQMADRVRPRTVVGVYLGWRGLPYDAGPLTNLSFWNRKETAARVGRGGVFELLARLKDYRDSRQPGETADPQKTQLVITGHSFGGLVVYSALSHPLMERAVKTSRLGTAARDDDVAKSFGDFVMLVNPAFEGSMYEPLFHVATNRCYHADRQRPVTMIVTSKADRATAIAFTIGRDLDTAFQHARSPAQRQSIRTAVGHDPRYRTHELVMDSPPPARDTIDASPCGCPFLKPTSNWTLDELLGPLMDALIGSDTYARGVSLRPVEAPRYAPSFPYLVVGTNADFIPDHNTIYNEEFILFTQLFFIKHVTGSLRWTDQRRAVPNCFATRADSASISGGLLPSGKSCRADAEGKSCSAP